MRVRRPWLVVVVLLIAPAAHADDHRADFYGAFSTAKGSALLGGHVTLGLTSAWPDTHDMSWLVDLSVHGGADNGNNVTRVGFMGGVRYAEPWISGDTHRLFGQFLAGLVRHHESAPDVNDPAIAAGFGYEYREQDNHDESGFAGRVQIEYVKVFSGGESFPRFSFGVAYRIGRKAP